MRECAYVRVSTETLEQDSSYNNQEQMYLSKGIQHIYKDKETGTSINRPQFIRMLQDCGLSIEIIGKKLIVLPTDKEPKYDKIYCKSIRRFSRDIQGAIDVIRELKNKGVYCVFEQESINTSDISSDFLLGILLGVAQQESINTSMRVKQGNKITAKNGVFRSFNIIGYNYDKNTKQIVVDDLEANIVKSVFDLRLNGYGSRKIANIINLQGYKTKLGKPFSSNTILNILQNKTYCGYVRRNVFFSDGFGDMTKRVRVPKSEHILVRNKDIPVIISEEDFDKVQELIQLSKHQYKNLGVNKSKNPLVGKIKCSNCGKNYIKVNNYYKCITKHKVGRKKCSNRDILIEDLDKVINHHVKIFRDKALVNLNVINITLDGCISVANSKRDNNTTELLERNTEAIRGHRGRINKLLDMLLDGEAKEVIKDKINSINEQIAILEKDNEILQQGESYIDDFIYRCEKVRDKITTYINSLPSGVDKEHYIKDYLISIKVGNKLSVEDKTVKHTKEVLSLHEEITDSTSL